MLSPLLFRKSDVETVNAEYIKRALARFLVVFRTKKSVILSRDWFLHWDKTPVHNAASVQEFQEQQNASRQSATLPIHRISP